VAGETRDSSAIPAMTGIMPAIISGFGPKRGTRRGVRRETPNKLIVIGGNATPAFSGLKPSTSCRNWVRKKNIPIMPATSSSRAANEPDRLASANSRSGVIGCEARDSLSRKPASSTTAAPNEASATGLPQPSEAALMKP